MHTQTTITAKQRLLLHGFITLNKGTKGGAPRNPCRGRQAAGPSHWGGAENERHGGKRKQTAEPSSHAHKPAPGNASLWAELPIGTEDSRRVQASPMDRVRGSPQHRKQEQGTQQGHRTEQHRSRRAQGAPTRPWALGKSRCPNTSCSRCAAVCRVQVSLSPVGWQHPHAPLAPSGTLPREHAAAGQDEGQRDSRPWK